MVASIPKGDFGRVNIKWRTLPQSVVGLMEVLPSTWTGGRCCVNYLPDSPGKLSKCDQMPFLLHTRRS